MNFRILCIIKILQPPLGWQNLDRTIAYTRFHRIKGGGGVPPPSPTNNFDRVDEISKIFMNPALCDAGSRIHKISSTLSKVIGDGRKGGGGGGHSVSAFYSVKLCVMINFSLRQNVLCLSFVVVLYSMYSLYAVIKVVLLNERDCHV